MSLEEIDKTGLIREAYRIDGIDEGQCKSIFLDWALHLPVEADHRAAITLLLDTYGQPDHPMSAVLRAGLEPVAPPRRRGRKARLPD
ncbi:MAG: hypothetical protein AAF748_10850 [Pseudomonadota bacterium]